jgi:hypothetical protein
MKCCTTVIINIQLRGVWCRLEESLSNYNQITSVVFSNLSRDILGLDIVEYIKSYIDTVYSNSVNAIAHYKKQKEMIQIPNFIGEVVIQFRDPYVAKWLITMYENKVLISQDNRQLKVTRYPEHPYVIIDRLKDFWSSMFLNNHKYSKITNICNR